MAKEHKGKSHSNNKGIDLGGTPDELINVMIDDQKERDWALKKLINGGSHHKQVLTAVLLNRLNKLVKGIELKTGSSFVLQHGNEVVLEKHKHKMMLPIPMPIDAGDDMDTDEIVKAISHAADREILMYAICLQVIEWGVVAIAKKK
jgi:hypothetical protein